MGRAVITTALSLALLQQAGSCCGPSEGQPRARKAQGTAHLSAVLGPLDNVYALAYSPDGRFLLSGGDQGHETDKLVVNRWDVTAKKLSTTLQTGNKRQIQKIAYSPSGKSFAVADYDGEVHVWSREGKKLNAFRHLENQVTTIKHLQFADEETLFSVDWHGVAQKWNIKNNRTDTSLLDSDIHLISAAGASPSLSFFAWCDPYSLHVDAAVDKNPAVKRRVRRDKGLVIVEMEADLKASAHIKFSKQIRMHKCAISADGAFVIAVSEKGMLYLFDISRKTMVKRWEGHQPTLNIYAVLALPDQKGFVTADAGGNIKFWSRTGDLIAQVRYYNSATCALALSPDGGVLATTGENQRILLWDLKAILRGKKR
jgi:WD40 repeat protein